jgi:hypothetical protein
VPVAVACLVPAAPALLAGLTGARVPELAGVRAAVASALAALAGVDHLVVVAPRVPGTLAGFGAPAAPTTSSPLGSWPHALAAVLLDSCRSTAGRSWLAWDEGAPAVRAAGAGAGSTGLLLLADGSRTRGPRAPGGQDPRGDVVDAELAAALREGRPPLAPDAEVVGATAGPAVQLLVDLTGRRAGAVDLVYAGAPLGVGYLVAVARTARRGVRLAEGVSG